MKQDCVELLAEALKRHAPEETILVTASRAEGRRMLSELAAEGHILVGVRAETPYSLAEELCAPWMSLPGASTHVLDELEGAELVRSCMDETNGMYSGAHAKTPRATRAFFRTFMEMDLAEIPEEAGDSDKLRELQELRKRYVQKKTAWQFKDRGDLFRMALIAAGKENCPLRRAHFVAPGDYAPAPLERRLLELLTSDSGLEVVKLPCAAGVDLPVGTLAEELPRVDAVEAVQQANARFAACRGMETEVRFPLRDMLDKQLLLEDCAVVCLSSAYLQPLYEEARRFGFPVTVGGGLPMTGSLLYTTLKQVRDLPLSDFNAEEVCALLESGGCRPEKRMRLADRIRRKKVGWGRERLELACRYDPAETGYPGEDVLESWKRFLTLLAAVAEPPRDGKLADRKKDLLDFLGFCNHIGPQEAAAYAKARDLAGHIMGLNSGDTALERLLGMMETTSYFGGSPEPGKLYCAPLSQAAFTGRKRLYILGFSRYAMQGSLRESPILLDRERDVLGGLKTSIQRGQEREFRLLTLLVRHGGELVLSFPDFDSDRMLPQEPEPFFRDVSGGHWETVGYIPQTDVLPTDKLLQESAVRIEGPQVHGEGSGETFQLHPMMTRRDQLQAMEFSATMLEDVTRCPYAFFLKRMLKVRAPQPVKRREDRWLNSAEIGSFCHAVLEEYYKLDQQRNWEAIFEERFPGLRDVAPLPRPELEQETREQIKLFLERAVDWTAKERRKVLETEKKFSGQQMTFGQRWTLRMQGSIDRVDQLQDGTIAVLDYKTGDPEKMKDEMDRHWQHYLYSLAEEQITPGRQVKKAGYLFLREEAELVEMKEDETMRNTCGQRIAWILDRLAAEGGRPDCMPCYKEKKTAKLPGEMRTGAVREAQKACKNWCEFAGICPEQEG